MFRFTIRDWFWLALVVALLVAWFLDRGRLTRPVVQGDVTIAVNDYVKKIQPGQHVLVRRDSSGRVSVRIENDPPDSGSDPISSGNVAQKARPQVTPHRETPRDTVAVDTPETVFAAYSAALAKRDWGTAYSHLTPEYRDFYLFELAFGLGVIGKDDLIAEHQDPAKLTKLNGVEGLDERQVREMLVNSFKDKEAFYRAAQEVLAKDDPEFPDGKLRSVKIDGQRARGTTTHYVDRLHITEDGVETRRREAYQSPVYFKKRDGVWRIDMPTPEEQRRDLESVTDDSETPPKELVAGGELDSTRGIANEAEMIRILSRRLPPGTPLEMARAFMEAQGFACSLTTNGRFGDREGIDYLYCTRAEDSGMFLVDRRWHVAIIVRDEKVVEIDASTGLVGL